MFDNIGRKIKTLAEASCCIGIIGSIKAAIVMIRTPDVGDYYYRSGYRSMATVRTTGWIMLFLGPLFSWLASLPLYALGEIKEETANTMQTLERITFQMEKMASSMSHCSEKAETASEEKEAYRPKNAVELVQEKKKDDVQVHLITVFDMYEAHISKALNDKNIYFQKRDILSNDLHQVEYMVWRSNFNQARAVIAAEYASNAEILKSLAPENAANN